MLLTQEYWRRLFILCNVFFVIFSIVLLALGIKQQITLNQFNVILQESKPSIFLIASISGGLGVLSACIGIFGLSTKQKLVIYVHIFALIVVTLMEIGTATKVAAVDNQFTSDSLSTSIKNYEKDYKCQMQFDNLQSTFHCCGANSSKDFATFPRFRSFQPSSCKYNTLLFPKGCISVLNEFVQKYVGVLMYLCFVFGIIQAIYIIMSIMNMTKFDESNSLHVHSEVESVEMLLTQEYWRRLFILCNVFFVIFSIVLLALGIKQQITLNQFNVILQESKPSIFLIASISGGLGVLSACIGIFGLSTKQKLVIYVHIFALIVVTLMEIGTATKVAAVDNQFTSDSLSTSIKNYEKDYKCQMQFDNLQSTFHCCGANSSKDYGTFARFRSFQANSCKYNTLLFPKGCISVLNEFVQKYVGVLMYLCFVFGIIQAIYIIMSIMNMTKFDESNSLHV
ncbi:25 kDa integral membrane protein [Schistosoma japonicum]|nr:25 kDa integral membrane protein [Schistosoma japonicum]